MRGKRSHPPNSNETQAHNQIYLPALHGLTGCDTVPCMFGIGKATTGLNELMGGHDLIELGQQGAYEDKLTSKGGHRSKLASLRFCVNAATERRQHTQVDFLWITPRFRTIAAVPINWERLDASVFTSMLPATRRKSRTFATRETDVISERKHRLYSRSAKSPPRTRLGWHG